MESLKQQWRKLIKEHTGDEAVQCRASGTIHISSELADMIANQVHLLNDIRRSRSSRQTPQHLQRHQAVAVAREFQQISSLNAMHTLSQRRAMASSEQGDSFETSTDNSPQPTRRQQVQQDTSVIDALSNHFERHAAQQEQLTEARNAYLERKISMMHETAELQKAESQARIEYLKAKTETIQTNYDSIEALKRSYEVTAKAYEDRFNRLETMLGSMMSQFSLLTQSGALSSDSLDPGTPRSRRRHTPSPSTTPTRRSQRSVRPRR
nr:uncharacterized protein BN887_03962 [Melanopsichium pennsylvanicum 4]